MSIDELKSLVIRALQSDFGVWVSTPEAEALKRKLYRARTELKSQGVPDIDTVTIRTSPRNPEGEVWLIPVLTEAEKADLEMAHGAG